MSIAILGVISLGGFLLLYLGYYLVGPQIDNAFGVLRARDLRIFLAHRLNGERLGQIVESRVGPSTWSSRHDDVIWATDIVCTDAAGRALSWNLSHSAPRDWLPRQA